MFKSKTALLWLVVLAYVGIQMFSVTAPWFAADDAQELAHVRSLDSAWALLGQDVFGLFRPVKNVLFAIFIFMSDHMGMVPCRTLAILLGIISFFAVLALVRRIFKDERLAIAASAIWLLSPTLVSSAAWLSCVNIQVMVLFSAWAIVAHDDGRWWLSSLLVFMACVSYECAVALAPLFLVFDFFMRPDRFSNRHWWWRYVVVAMVVVIFLLIRAQLGAATSVNGSFVKTSREEIVMASAYLSCQHFLSWLCPLGRMTVFGGYVSGHVHWCLLAMSWIVLILVAVVAFKCRRRFPAMGFGLAFTLVAFLPVSNVSGIGNGPYGDYYLTLASVGLSVALVAVCQFRRRLAMVVLTLRLLMVPEAAHWAYLWADGNRAFAASVDNFPEYFPNQSNLAMRCADLKLYDLALGYCDQVEKIVGADSGHMGQVYLVRALHAINVRKDAANAFKLLEKSRRNSDRSNVPLMNRGFYRGCVYEDVLGDTAAAEKEYASALSRKWTVDSVQAADRLARLLAMRGETALAITIWEKALRLKPDDAGIRHNLETARLELGQVDRK